MTQNIESKLKAWLSPLEGNWPDVYMVGGAVRDQLLSRTPKDIDLVCKNAKDVANRLADARDAVVVPFEKKADEPCFRVVDRQHNDKFLDIARMRGESILEDLKLRDFTANAIAVQLKKGSVPGDVIDPLNGRSDLKKRLVRITKNSAIVSDPLRILRAVRFASELDFSIEKSTLSSMKKHAGLLKKVSFERITAELLKIFNTHSSALFVKMMDELNILEVIFPEIIEMKVCTQNSFHHLNVWDHSMAVLENCEFILNHLQDFFGQDTEQIQKNLESNNRLPLLKLSALFHDVGKPKRRNINQETGRITFYGHDKEGEEIAAIISERLKMSKKNQAYMKLMIAEHLHILNLSQPDVKPVTRIRWFRKLADDSIPVIILGLADIKGTLWPSSNEEDRNSQIKWSQDTVAEYYDRIKKQLEHQDLISGKDLLTLGMIPGPVIGKILKRVRQAQDDGLVKNRNEALDYARKLKNVKTEQKTLYCKQ